MKKLEIPTLTSFSLGHGTNYMACDDQVEVIPTHVGTNTKRPIRYKNLSLDRKVSHRRQYVVISHDFEMPMDLSPSVLERFGLLPKVTP